MHVYTVSDDLEGPYDDTSGLESVDVRDLSVTAWSGHGESRSGDAGHDADWSSSLAPSRADDALWVDSTAVW